MGPPKPLRVPRSRQGPTRDQRAREDGHGRSAETPSDIPARGWKDIALRVYRVAFENNKTSESTALAYILLFTVIVLTNLYLYFANQRARDATP